MKSINYSSSFFFAIALGGLTLSFQPQASAAVVLGIGEAALLGGDLTDPENDGVDSPEPNGGGGFNWVSISASAEAFFDTDNVNPRQGSFDVFDNRINNGEGKFCCSPASWNVTVEFAEAYVLTHFTVASNQDSIGRNPDVWQVQGSNDGNIWSNIFVFDNDDTSAPNNRLHAGNSPWTAGNQVIRWNGDGDDFATPEAFRFFRFNADSAAGWVGTGGELSLAEIELFGTPIPEPSSLAFLALTGTALIRRRR